MDISTEDMSNITLDGAWTASAENGQNILYITVSNTIILQISTFTYIK